jgi:predicted FMN-binding regulatory protein PaiB
VLKQFETCDKLVPDFNFLQVTADNSMSKRQPYKVMRSLHKQIAEHHEKIMQEQGSDNPQVGLIHHWQQEIRAFTIQLERLENRIARRRRRGK